MLSVLIRVAPRRAASSLARASSVRKAIDVCGGPPWKAPSLAAIARRASAASRDADIENRASVPLISRPVASAAAKCASVTSRAFRA